MGSDHAALIREVCADCHNTFIVKPFRCVTCASERLNTLELQDGRRRAAKAEAALSQSRAEVERLTLDRDIYEARWLAGSDVAQKALRDLRSERAKRRGAEAAVERLAKEQGGWQRRSEALDTMLADECSARVKAVTQVERLRAQYDELLLAVVRKWPDETRHQTALRYITEAETPSREEGAHVVRTPPLFAAIIEAFEKVADELKRSANREAAPPSSPKEDSCEPNC